MATLYVENVPDDLYRALRQRAQRNRQSIAAEVVKLLEENVPTAHELASRRASLRRIQRMRMKRPGSAGLFPATEEVQREDRSR